MKDKIPPFESAPSSSENPASSANPSLSDSPSAAVPSSLTIPDSFTIPLSLYDILDLYPVIREKPEIYAGYQKELEPFYTREDLTPVEKVCIGNYQDIHFWNRQKQNWSCKIPEDMKDKPWCYMINSCCRFPNFYNERTESEKRLIDFNIKNIDAAIEKSTQDVENFIYRGVLNLNWLDNPVRGETFQENAFGSFNLKRENACKYTNSEKPIIFRLKLKKDMKALYIDNKEYEIIRPRNIGYRIIKIEQWSEKDLEFEKSLKYGKDLKFGKKPKFKTDQKYGKKPNSEKNLKTNKKMNVYTIEEI
ncbi:hypothetical protein MmiAt1_04600 [Methanimicrococcus sp. At1]|uniref:ADP ribosyltransferase domain-containing protein n=1 Tax=Methanimicrococcus hacksteinii TaxID=3028293 RepID=A0ABU3VND9_9EURY|nr:ADP-ribosyltransferase [Methanimicrococcus sp. At1]MDV0444912.1 hypothetical protein [Methanimicrococcus sp. At1]